MWIDDIRNYVAFNELETKEQAVMLDAYEVFGDRLLERELDLYHLTVSSMILNRDHTKVLMVYHNIYKSYSWTGGHCDGDPDLLGTALREAREETGLEHVDVLKDGAICSLEIIPVFNHIKRGKVVNTHLHLNVSYLFEADELEEVRVKEDENSDVKWIALEELDGCISESDREMIPIYHKLLREYL